MLVVRLEGEREDRDCLTRRSSGRNVQRPRVRSSERSDESSAIDLPATWPRNAPLHARLRADIGLRRAAGALSGMLAIVFGVGVGAILLLGVVPHGGFDPPGSRSSGSLGMRLPRRSRGGIRSGTDDRRDGYTPGPSPASSRSIRCSSPPSARSEPDCWRRRAGLGRGDARRPAPALAVDRARVGRRRPGGRRSGGARGGAGADGLLLQRGLQRVGLPGADAGGVSLRPSGALGVGRAARRPVRGDAVLGTARRGRARRALARAASSGEPVGSLAAGRAARGPRPAPPAVRGLLWSGIVPLGLLAYLGWLDLLGLDPLAPFSSQHEWFRHFTGPVRGVLDGAGRRSGARQCSQGRPTPCTTRRPATR